jgi:hypothetical protein
VRPRDVRGAFRAAFRGHGYVGHCRTRNDDPLPFGAIAAALDEILPVQDDRRMTRQADRGAFGAVDPGSNLRH